MVRGFSVGFGQGRHLLFAGLRVPDCKAQRSRAWLSSLGLQVSMAQGRM